MASVVVSLSLRGILSYQWTKARQFDPSSNQLASQTQVDQVLERYAKDMNLDRADIIGLSTGAFIQSLSFSDTSEVYLTGYLWQRYINELPDDPYAPWKDSCEHDYLPWVLPDRVRLGDDKEPRLAYSEVIRGQAVNDESAPPSLGMLCGWFFEATLRQAFNYRRYPFDNTIISLRIWLRDPDMNVVTTPDFSAYPNGTGYDDLFGINEQMVLNSWERKNTYFTYTYLDTLNTNLGMLDMNVVNKNPELNYRFVIKRKLVDSMVEHLLGILVVMILLYATLLVISRDEEKADRHGFNTAMVLGACSALFFVILISHIQIRTQFSGTSVVYLEGFYYLTYLLLIMTTINTYLFSENPNHLTAVLHYRDNIVPKLLYWPVVLSSSVVWTHFMLLAGV
jgi:hypothetical protein